MPIAGMDQTFDFRSAPVPLHRHVKPWAIALALAGLVVVSGLAAFSLWVIESERRSIELASKPADIGSLVGRISGTETELEGPTAESERLASDSTARGDARTALAAARRAASGSGTFLDAGPGELSAIGSPMIFVDGPSQAPGVVSVASTRAVWGAAVMGPSGTCYLLRVASGEGVTYGTGESCTGAAALTVTDPSW